MGTFMGAVDDRKAPPLLVDPTHRNFEFVCQLIGSKKSALLASIARGLDLFPHVLADCIQEHFAKDGILSIHFWFSPWTLEGPASRSIEGN
jgi:hypothetical protein